VARKTEPSGGGKPATAKARGGAPLQGIELVERAISIVEADPFRPRASDGSPGGLVELPPSLRPIIIGDLHANLENLERIIDANGNRDDLEAGKAVCVIVGDVEHDDRTGHMKEMESSIVILEALFRLLDRYAGNVVYLRGNHDTFDERLRKSGIAQGLELKMTLLAARGQEYVNAVQRFFESLPVFVIGKGFVITHAGPPHGGLDRQELIDIRKYPDKYHQLMWTRVNEFHGGNPSPKEYGEGDVRLALEMLNLPPDTHFIVGHNPLWGDGNTTGFWKDVVGIKNHHIIYSGSGSQAPYLTWEDGILTVKFGIPKATEAYYYG
jgi:predicted phosphodiesterase